MTQYTYNKLVNPSRLMTEIKAAGLMDINYISTSNLTVLIYFNNALSAEQKGVLDSVVSNHVNKNTQEVISDIIDDAIYFGSLIQKDFVVENVLLGITQRGLTGHVRRVLREVKDCIETGSLYDAVTEIKNLNPEDFDDVIITPARLLAFRNKIEGWLEVPLATAWDDDETWL